MRYFNLMFRTGLLIMLFGALAFGQATRAFRPGQTITIEIEFDGVDAHRIHTALAFMDLPSSDVRDGQKNLQTEMEFENPAPSGEHAIKVSHKVSVNDAAGNYKLTQIRLGTDPNSPAWFTYSSEKIPEFRVVVDNDEHLVQPTINGVKDVSNH